MIAEAPSWVQDSGAWALFFGGLATAAGFAAWLVRLVIRDEVPKAMANSMPDVTRAMVREEVEAAVEPHAAMLRQELQPNGGSSMVDMLNVRLDRLESGQQALFARLPGG